MSLPALEWCLDPACGSGESLLEEWPAAKPGHSLLTPAQPIVVPLVSTSSRMKRIFCQCVSISCGLSCPSWAQQCCLEEVGDPSCTLCLLCAVRGGDGNAEAPLCWQVAPLSHLQLRSAESPRISQPHLWVLLTTLKLAVPALLPSWIAVGVSH